MTPTAFAANAYRVTQGLANRAEPRQTAGEGSGGPDFGQMLKAAVGDVAQQGRAAEAKQFAYANGKADVLDVVTAVAETQTAFETMVTVRDKVIAAYEEIMKMPI
jgi:flagellar hook-basal body complex protein FliE